MKKNLRKTIDFIYYSILKGTPANQITRAFCGALTIYMLIILLSILFILGIFNLVTSQLINYFIITFGIFILFINIYFGFFYFTIQKENEIREKFFRLNIPKNKLRIYGMTFLFSGLIIFMLTLIGLILLMIES